MTLKNAFKMSLVIENQLIMLFLLKKKYFFREKHGQNGLLLPYYPYHNSDAVDRAAVDVEWRV